MCASEPDAVFLPELDGLQLARALRAAPRHARMCLIALTGYGQASDRDASIAAGFDHHMVKPADVPRLEAIVAAAGRGRAPSGR